MAPGTGATTIDANTDGTLSAACSGGSAITLNFITNGDTTSAIQFMTGESGGTVGATEVDDPETTVPLIAATDGPLIAAITGGTADGGTGLQVTYNLSTESGGDTPDSPPSGCLIAGTKVSA